MHPPPLCHANRNQYCSNKVGIGGRLVDLDLECYSYYYYSSNAKVKLFSEEQQQKNTNYKVDTSDTLPPSPPIQGEK